VATTAPSTITGAKGQENTQAAASFGRLSAVEMLGGDTGQLYPRANAELGEYVTEVGIDRIQREEELGSRLAICV
jgi:hypothetical protein